MDTDRILRHDARNFMNALWLNLQALELADTAEDRLECLDGIDRAADEALGWVARFERHHEAAAGQPG